ncbi:hypothetical protein C8F01DRAFT_758943 [Mycena amicta]|nr:hypothetical protein C8F01DRAFT_757548 [Mycena amicta]KAJ7049418.1 hypothetical protein C8F01DRAFT_758943 [Mycena amicta]
MKPNSTPCLPPELERLLFRTAALVSPSDARTFLLVAFRVKEWVEPLLYHSLVIRSPTYSRSHISDTIPNLTRKAFDAFDALVDSKSPSFLAASVQNLLLVRLSIEDVCLILSICSGVKDLFVLPSSAKHDGALDSLIGLQRPKCKVSQFFDLEISSALATQLTLAHLTHLEIFNEDRHNAAELIHMWLELLALPALTHLACSWYHWEALPPEKNRSHFDCSVPIWRAPRLHHNFLLSRSGPR